MTMGYRNRPGPGTAADKLGNGCMWIICVCLGFIAFMGVLGMILGALGVE